MTTFKQLTQKLQERYKYLEDNYTLFTVDIGKDDLWNFYQGALENNELFFENREYDCNACKKFIRAIGPVVAIKDNKLISIWELEDVVGEYKTMVNTMNHIMTNTPIKNKFIIQPKITANRMVGGLPNVVKEDNQTVYRDKIGMTFHHFNVVVKADLIKEQKDSILAKVRSRFDAYKRSCEEITPASIDTVKDLISADLYRGAEHLPAITNFELLLQGYTAASNKELYLWDTIQSNNNTLKNTVIGTLLIDVQTEELETAVKSFESKVAPSNYKRTNAVVTPKMKAMHLKIIEDEGIEESLYKRFAVLPDVNVTDVLFVDSSISSKMQDGIAGLMEKGVTKNLSLGTVRDTLTLDTFVNNIVPKADSISLLFDNNHTGNLVSLIAPKFESSPNIQQWDNNFSWSYNGGVTDSMKEKVKSAGGRVDGVMRFSIQWNEDRLDQSNDLDAHCNAPEGHIYYGNKCGRLDVDIQRPASRTAVENITWLNHSDIKNGEYRFYVDNYSGQNTKGFRAQIELDGEIHEFDYPTSVTKNVVVATVSYKNGVFKLNTNLESSTHSKDIWNLKTRELIKVDSLMYSPNYWQENAVGNKHLFFMLDNCKNPNEARGLYNEHLNGKYRDLRKSIDMLSGLVMCKVSDEQISGVGFSETLKTEFTVVVRGNGVNGTYLIKT